ncbi:DUF4271 domain-containing protein [Poritiphilus flavus]|uniref:DUF4271 domain-containing protein n=1 Tax=Poritiphilus flavus TaxID=2697053 RepID=A0A6L9EDD7_9FLAO|nr:DUF4271 domain-containing protein [Poritiphilus flavus]NAS12706.1 DUF4271 domain-containing protein [Poritiphilus flavus]
MEPILRTGGTVDWITVTLFASLLFLVVAKSLFYGRFLNFIILPFNNKYVVMYNKKDKLLNWFHIFLTVFQLLNCALFLHFVWQILISPANRSQLIIFISILGALILFLLLKVFLQLSNGFVFNNTKVISEFIFRKLSYLNYSALIMFVTNVLLAYVFEGSKAVVFVSIFVIIVINGIGWFSILKNHQKFIASYFFYFILYLCALEFAPFIIIANYLKD